MISKTKYILCAIILVIIGYGVFLYYQNKQLKNDLEIQIHNELALTDTMRILKTKEGKLLYDKSMLIIQSKEELERLTNFKNSQISTLENELNSKVNVITNLTGEVNTLNGRIKELNTQLELTDSVDIYKIKFGETDKWHTLNGYTELKSKTKPLFFKTYLTENKINLSLIVGVTENYKIFVETDGNPYVQITNINGANLDVKKYSNNTTKKRWGVGINGGYGYSLISNKFEPNIGLGIQWIIFSF